MGEGKGGRPDCGSARITPQKIRGHGGVSRESVWKTQGSGHHRKYHQTLMNRRIGKNGWPHHQTLAGAGRAGEKAPQAEGLVRGGVSGEDGPTGRGAGSTVIWDKPPWVREQRAKVLSVSCPWDMALTCL